MKTLFFNTIIISLTLFTSGCHSYETYLMKPVSERFSETIENISGDVLISHIIIGKNEDMLWGGVGYNVTLYCRQSNDLNTLGLKVFYKGNEWKFIDGITLRTDNGLIRLISIQPNRDVGYGGGVFETLYLPIFNETDRDNLISSSTLSFQLESNFREKVIDVSPTTMNNIREFLNEFSNCSN